MTSTSASTHALTHRPSPDPRHAAAEHASALREAGLQVPAAEQTTARQPDHVELGPSPPPTRAIWRG
ncbi:hypothetical protein [Streptomyces sp. NPDC056061]|uniref:hypothetical protein n=1 Tax=Streptomyces sp. NPDC056061 TaxID=3345700 RepID=UPI0035E23A41